MQTSTWLWQAPAAAMIVGYLLGSIPFGIILTRMFGAGDLRKIGSGNIGATNVLRTGRKGLAAATLLLDGGKGALAVWLGEMLVPGGGAMAGVMAFIGHCFPIWLRFRGGKGVATMLAVALALHWPVGLVFAGVWLGMLAIFRISSLSGMTAAISAPVAALFMGQIMIVPPLAGMAPILLWRHKANIARLLKGEEPRVGKKAEA